MPNHEGRRYWLVFIYRNIDKLTSKSGVHVMAGLSDVLEQASSTTQTTTAAFFTVRSSKICTQRVCVSRLAQSDPFWKALRGGDVDETFKPLFYNERFQSVLSPMLKHINTENLYSHATCVVTYDTTDKLKLKQVQVFLTGNSGYHNSQRFINLIRRRKDTYKIFSVELTKRSRPVDRDYATEVQYVEQYAPHKVKVIADNIKATTGVMYMKDLTSTVEMLMYANRAESIAKISG